MDNNPFITKAPEKLNISSSREHFLDLEKANIKPLSFSEKTAMLFKYASIKAKDSVSEKLKKVTDPLCSRAESTKTFLLSEKKNLLGEKDSGVYFLLNLLDNPKKQISAKAASALQRKCSNLEDRAVIIQYFKNHPEARENFRKLYSTLQEKEK